MAKICKVLQEEGAQGTLAEMPQTFSAMYTVVTSHLYRFIHLGLTTVIPFSKLFNMFPRSDNQRFFHPVPSNLHLADMHIADRLHVSLSHTLIEAVCAKSHPHNTVVRFPKTDSFFLREGPPEV